MSHDSRTLPLLAEEAALKERFLVEFVAHGPTVRGWEGDYLKCPECRVYVLKGRANHGCSCGNIFVDADAGRVAVKNGPESRIEAFRVLPK